MLNLEVSALSPLCSFLCSPSFPPILSPFLLLLLSCLLSFLPSFLSFLHTLPHRPFIYPPTYPHPLLFLIFLQPEMQAFPNPFGNSGGGGLAPGSPGKGSLVTTSFTGLPSTASQLTGQVHVSVCVMAEKVLHRMEEELTHAVHSVLVSQPDANTLPR